MPTASPVLPGGGDLRLEDPASRPAVRPIDVIDEGRQVHRRPAAKVECGTARTLPKAGPQPELMPHAQDPRPARQLRAQTARLLSQAAASTIPTPAEPDSPRRQAHPAGTTPEGGVRRSSCGSTDTRSANRADAGPQRNGPKAAANAQVPEAQARPPGAASVEAGKQPTVTSSLTLTYPKDSHGAYLRSQLHTRASSTAELRLRYDPP